VLELCGAREVTHVIGTFPDVKQATCIFETVCNLIREDSGSLSPQDLAFALEMNDKGMPHMPPPLIRGHLGIAFIPQKLEWVRRHVRRKLLFFERRSIDCPSNHSLPRRSIYTVTLVDRRHLSSLASTASLSMQFSPTRLLRSCYMTFSTTTTTKC
jgi:hypothetical protein